jgi:hypothetical protein
LIQKNKVPLDTFQGKATYRFKSIKEWECSESKEEWGGQNTKA